MSSIEKAVEKLKKTAQSPESQKSAIAQNEEIRPPESAVAPTTTSETVDQGQLS